ncbi:adenine phosphoribosyltransferase [Prochlorococcus marinus]|uniref:adenine phosphoribosyltransferase n=1 Tax=Prochlorococcus marinus TaxID=1219 RepID=UPI001ADAD51A|nr:adenine phosphoribosyltransferase [Prochlorococcus marinus]MBO8217855.1 adenine phosphoribosyltransferase [Prochlorococcus marinus XMU1405]MBW3041012.1 adenine phosphoribosyltransferase [Prochlorococcus marinus str. MU1405]MBW3048472.1 adenine phosphoribosyltransferase [Prochlorococcus marinus str. MU1406]
MTENLKDLVKDHINFPKSGIIFKDILPLLQYPDVFSKVIEEMSSSQIFKDADAILSIDARGFIFGTAISFYLSKPMIVARKPGKLPGNLINRSYDLEYGSNSLSIQVDALKPYNSFAVVDDLLATGGTIKCVSEMLKDSGKVISGLSVVIELGELNGRDKFDFPVESNIVL